MSTVVLTLVVLLILGAATYFFIVYSGVISVAADPGGGGLLSWTMDHTMDHSVDRHSAGIKVPPLDDPVMIQAAAGEYDHTCAFCHGAPGRDSAGFVAGMDPSPPDYKDIGNEQSPQFIFWVAKNGVEMTGMPSFAKEGDQKLWAFVALIKTMPKMTPAQYQNLVSHAPVGKD